MNEKTILSTFDFNHFKKTLQSGGLKEDIYIVSDMLENNPLLDEILWMKGNALAIIDVQSMSYPLILGDVEQVCGWTKEHCHQVGIEGYVAQFLPDSFWGLNQVFSLINQYVATLNKEQLKLFKSIYDYEMKGGDGSIRRILEENIALKTNQEGQIIHFLAYISKISHLKSEGKQHIHLSGGNKARLFELNHRLHTIEELVLPSKRELEVALLLGKGYISEAIAQQLFISVHTVNTHRQNLLRKLRMSDATELINFLKLYRIIV
jgi:DNA-binding CsgD family transcriptional regulator